MAEKRTILGGKVHVTNANAVPLGEGTTYLEGRNRRVSRKEDSLTKAKECELMTAGERNAVYVQGHRGRLKNHLVPCFGQIGISPVTSGAVQVYRMFRVKPKDEPDWNSPPRSTLHHGIVTPRQVHKTALRHGRVIPPIWRTATSMCVTPVESQDILKRESGAIRVKFVVFSDIRCKFELGRYSFLLGASPFAPPAGAEKLVRINGGRSIQSYRENRFVSSVILIA